jgi:hypothetical protein
MPSRMLISASFAFFGIRGLTLNISYSLMVPPLCALGAVDQR